MGLRTPLYATHVQNGAKLIDFGGWDMPLHYGSQLDEHHAVRRDAGMFDVSHMGVVDMRGTGARAFLSYLLANDVAKLRSPGKALYSCMLLPAGGVLDDLVVYFLAEDWFRLVVNAGTREADLSWISAQAAPFEVVIAPRPDLAMIAVQGPQARARVLRILPEAQRAGAEGLAVFSGAVLGDWFVARTGYTGEDGFEIILPAAQVTDAWRRLLESNVAPAGLGARDTLRLEAGMSLYGNDLDERHHPLESGLGWTVAFEPRERDFIGRGALDAVRDSGGGEFELVGLLLEERGVLRSHQKVFARVPGSENFIECGDVTSGSFSPTLNRAIALARIAKRVLGPADAQGRADARGSAAAQGSAAGQGSVEVEIRGKRHAARIVKPPFVRRGKALIEV